MRPFAYRLRLVAVLLGIAQGVAPAVAIAHEVAAAELAAPVAHMESQGASHDVSTHSHDCGICRDNASKFRWAPGASPDFADSPGLRSSGWSTGASVVHRDDGSGALPRGPPVG